LDHCQNGTVSFPAINITVADAPKIIEGFFGNSTAFNSTEGHRNRTRETKGKTKIVRDAAFWNPCPTTLFFPETASSEGSMNDGNLVVVFGVFVAVVGFANGLAW
jgi:hypothetical protein